MNFAFAIQICNFYADWDNAVNGCLSGDSVESRIDDGSRLGKFSQGQKNRNGKIRTLGVGFAGFRGGNQSRKEFLFCRVNQSTVSPGSRNRHLPSGKLPSLILPIRTRFNPIILKPTDSHMRRICRFLPSVKTNRS